MDRFLVFKTRDELVRFAANTVVNRVR